MILIGQFDSPFVRRVGIALTHYDLPFEHWPWSAFSDADRLRAYNPLTRVPTLILDDGDVLIDSHIMIDHLDSLVPAERRLYPTQEPARRRALKVATLATGVADKSVSLFYGKRMHGEISPAWAERLRAQVMDALAALETDRAARDTDYWFGDHIGHADVAVGCAIRFTLDTHPGFLDMTQFPALAAHVDWLEGLPVFRKIFQPFIAPS